MDLHFDCTMCGRCCHDLKLPLSVDEAIDWIERGGTVHLYCEALPWPADPAADDAWAWYKGARGFAAKSGVLSVRVLVTLVAAQEGACPFLLPDMRCGAYEYRPRVCRIYPAEINPLLVLSPDAKQCPPEAWSAEQPLFATDARVIDPETSALSIRARDVAIEDVPAKERLCGHLGIDRAALGNEGFVIHRPSGDRLLAGLREARGSGPQPATRWSIASNRASMIAMLDDAGAISVRTSPGADYIGFFADELGGDI
jgi:Fe-S-cluster containining protein